MTANSRHVTRKDAVTKGFVYIAGPYTKGDVVVNVKNAVMMGNNLRALGFTPFIPHLTMFWQLIQPHDIEYWYAYDMEWLEKCDAVFRLSGESKGAEAETERAFELGIPVFMSVLELRDWAETRNTRGSNSTGVSSGRHDQA